MDAPSPKFARDRRLGWLRRVLLRLLPGFLILAGWGGGAFASEHWSLQPLKASVIPSLPDAPGEVRNAIDRFVLAKLRENRLAPSVPADRTTLIRRVYFDLIGLPPSPEAVEAFVADSSDGAYEKLVEGLLNSPGYGERWGRHWLDVARYTESQGFEYDRLRDNAWHYRDYVIRSFNEDKPYDRFMREQIAGDVLEPVTRDGIVGASLLVCGPWDQAGNSQANVTQKAITREEEIEDMLSVVGQTFLGLTINCARCHAHKFDPIPHAEYYRIKSVFEGVKHGERSILGAAEEKDRKDRLAALERELAEFRSRASQLEAEGWKRAVAGSEAEGLPAGPQALQRWRFDRPEAAGAPDNFKGGARAEGGKLHLERDGAYYQSAPLPDTLREKTLEAWVALADLKQGGGAPISIESLDGQVFDAIVFGERQPGKWIAGSSGFARTRDLDAPAETAGPEEFVHMMAVYRADNSIALFRNGEPYGAAYTPSAALRTFPAGQSHVIIGLRHKGAGNGFLRGGVRQAAIYDRALDPGEVRLAYRSGGKELAREQVLAALSGAERAEHEKLSAQIKQTKRAIEAAGVSPVSYAGTRSQPAPTKRLVRGDVNSPAEVVTPGALSAVTTLKGDFDLPADAPEAQRRVKFADWLADPRNPLPARVIANRVWHLHFGEGLVATPNDFGVSGSRPSHPELLDWLAAQLIESGWSLKALHRLIVHSATYRQSSAWNAAAGQVDAGNQLLWRFSPRRLEAETLRDAMLATSGRLNPTMGGPSFRPFEVLAFPANAYLPIDKIGPEFERRTVYRMNVNSGKEPMLDAFDCPDPAVKTPRRGVTTTPLQALALMNNSFAQRLAASLAERALQESGGDVARAAGQAYRLALGRAPTPAETERALAAARDRGLTSVCWALFNSTEFVYVR